MPPWARPLPLRGSASPSCQSGRPSKGPESSSEAAARSTADRRGSIRSPASANRARPSRRNGVSSASTDSAHRPLVATRAARQYRHLDADLMPLDVDVRHDGLASLAALEGRTASSRQPGADHWQRRLRYYYPARKGWNFPCRSWRGTSQERQRPALRRGCRRTRCVSLRRPRASSRAVLPVEGRRRSPRGAAGDAPGWIVERLSKIAAKEKTRAATDPVEWAKLTAEPSPNVGVHATKVAGKLVRANLPRSCLRGACCMRGT